MKYHFALRIEYIKKTGNTRISRNVIIGTLIHWLNVGSCWMCLFSDSNSIQTISIQTLKKKEDCNFHTTRDSTSGTYLQNIKTMIQRNICIPMFIYIYIIEYYDIIKMKSWSLYNLDGIRESSQVK